MKESVAFVLLAFLSATTAKVHVQNRKASKVIEDQAEANNFLKRQSGCTTCPSGERCCDPSFCVVTGSFAGKCFKYLREVERENLSLPTPAERGRELQEKAENAREGWR